MIKTRPLYSKGARSEKRRPVVFQTCLGVATSATRRGHESSPLHPTKRGLPQQPSPLVDCRGLPTMLRPHMLGKVQARRFSAAISGKLESLASSLPHKDAISYKTTAETGITKKLVMHTGRTCSRRESNA